MPEPLKNLFNDGVIRGMAQHFARHDPSFDAAGFVSFALLDLELLELKQRSDRIMEAMERFLPDDFACSGNILIASLRPDDDGDMAGIGIDETGIAGWAIMPMADYVAWRGQEHFDLAMRCFYEMTRRFSAEFGIRPFLISQPAKTLAVLQGWLTDPSRHVRRLISEGTRPRLPWGMQIPGFVADPAPILPLLEALRDDTEEYVRRSVANNLNDIAKNHPDLVAGIAQDWLQDAGTDRHRLVRHACRTLIKQGHPGVMQAFGFGAVNITLQQFEVITPVIRMGESVDFCVEFVLNEPDTRNVVLDYVMHHRKANGTTSPKVFKWKTIRLEPGQKTILSRRHVIRAITTRRYHPGIHTIELLINGRKYGSACFDLVPGQAA
ncbi:MAG: DNA alkylation repair protein [Pseudomonadota bacterium]